MVKRRVALAWAVVGFAFVFGMGLGVTLPMLRSVASFAAPVGPVDAATAVVDRWRAAYDANDADGLTKLYTVDATLHGTKSRVLSERSEAIRSYFTSVRKPGDNAKVTFGDKRVVALNDRVVLVTGFYEFVRPASKGPSRFTFVITRRGNDWPIVHHHSSPLP